MRELRRDELRVWTVAVALAQVLAIAVLGGGLGAWDRRAASLQAGQAASAALPVVHVENGLTQSVRERSIMWCWFRWMVPVDYAKRDGRSTCWAGKAGVWAPKGCCRAIRR